MVEYIRDGVKHVVAVASKNDVPEVVGGVVVSVRPENMHPSIDELRQAEIARRRRLGVCADLLAGVA